MPQNSQRPSRIAACEPCRLAKQSCNHEKPVCSRCRRRDKEDECLYRDRPFKRKRPSEAPEAHPGQGSPLPYASDDQLSSPPVTGTSTRDCESGFFGASSHVTIFQELGREAGMAQQVPASNASLRAASPIDIDHDAGARQCITVIDFLMKSVDLEAVSRLVHFWLEKGTSLALAAAFLPIAAERTIRRLRTWQTSAASSEVICVRIIEQTSRPFVYKHGDTYATFLHDMFEETRWEAILLTLVTIGRACTDIPFWPPLYKDRKARRRLQRLCLQYAEKCLEACLSIECTNEMLLACQIELWIFYTMVHGDQNFDSWRRLGDIISSALFLGLNEEILVGPKCPWWLAEFRRTLFASAFGADKHNAVFTGRPPRLNRHFCCFQLPHGQVGEEPPSAEIAAGSGRCDLGSLLFSADATMDSCAATRWMAICAYLKEEALEVSRRPVGQLKSEAVRTMIDQSARTWNGLPAHFRIERSLRPHIDRPPFELDFVLSCRLQYLQVLFLLHGHEGDSIIKTSEEMLSLVTDAIVLRDHIVNSGTSLIWKVSNFGLRAAGMVSLSLLRSRNGSASGSPGQYAVQNLCVLVSEIRGGGFVSPGQPNYDLLDRAASSIQRLLDQILSYSAMPIASLNQEAPISCDAGQQLPLLDAMLPLDSWESELEFWQLLGEHPM